MESYLPENEYTEFENRVYSNPQVSVDEANTFIDNLRSSQGQQNQGIFNTTKMLGTNVPSNLGGLLGGTGYFTSRYQTPQTNANIANLRATAQAQALNDVLSNEQAKWKQRYQKAYNAYQKSAYNKSQSAGLSGTTSGGLNNLSDLEEMLKSLEFGNKPVTFDEDLGIRAGWGEWNDLFTGKYNFTLPGGRQVELGGRDEQLKFGSDGNYYIYNSRSGKYTKIEGDEGNNSDDGGNGESRWWTR